MKDEKKLDSLLASYFENRSDLPNHPAEALFDAYIEGELDPTRRAAFMEHVSKCSRCLDLLEHVFRLHKQAKEVHGARLFRPLKYVSPPQYLFASQMAIWSSDETPFRYEYEFKERGQKLHLEEYNDELILTVMVKRAGDEGDVCYVVVTISDADEGVSSKSHLLLTADRDPLWFRGQANLGPLAEFQEKFDTDKPVFQCECIPSSGLTEDRIGGLILALRDADPDVQGRWFKQLVDQTETNWTKRIRILLTEEMAR